jgi:hypothetical protein
MTITQPAQKGLQMLWAIGGDRAVFLAAVIACLALAHRLAIILNTVAPNTMIGL